MWSRYCEADWPNWIDHRAQTRMSNDSNVLVISANAQGILANPRITGGRHSWAFKYAVAALCVQVVPEWHVMHTLFYLLRQVNCFATCKNTNKYVPISHLLWFGLSDIEIPSWFKIKHITDYTTVCCQAVQLSDISKVSFSITINMSLIVLSCMNYDKLSQAF